MTKRYFSPSTLGWYCDDVAYASPPSDLVLVDEATYQSLQGQALAVGTGNQPIAATPPPITIEQQIQGLEGTVTARRLREAVLGTDNGWLSNLNAQIASLRSQLTK